MKQSKNYDSFATAVLADFRMADVSVVPTFNDAIVELGEVPVVSEAQPMWAYSSRMAFHLIREYVSKETILVKDRHAFADVKGYDGDKHFRAQHETKQLLDACVAGKLRTNGEPVEYGIATIQASGKKTRKAASAWTNMVRAYGYKDKVSGNPFRLIYGNFLDEGFLLMVSADSDIRSLKDLGIGLTDDVKAGKRFRRDTAHHTMMIEVDLGEMTTNDEGDSIIALHCAQLDLDLTYCIKNMEAWSEAQVSQVDGAHIVNFWSKVTGNPAHDHIVFTGCVNGDAKGSAHRVDTVKYDIVAYGVKTELVMCNGKGYLGILGELKEHDLRTDIQSTLNMGFFESHLAPALAIAHLETLKTALLGDDEGVIRDMMAELARVAEGMDEFDEFGRTQTKEAEELWATIRALKIAHGTKTMPVLFRRLVNSLLENTLDLVHGKIQMPELGSRLYVAFNLSALSETGTPIAALDLIPEGCVCIPDKREGEVCLLRNPQTHNGEVIFVMNVHVASLMRYKGRGLCFFGKDAGKLLGVLNGGDQDDNVVCIEDAAWIACAKAHSNYPVVPKIVLAECARPNESVRAKVAAGVNAIRAPRAVDGGWTFKNMRSELDIWIHQGTSLGAFINRIMLDTSMSAGNKAYALESLKEGRVWVPENFSGDIKAFTAECIAFTEQREDYILRREASNSDMVIDYLQMRKGDADTVNSLLKHSEEAELTPWFPMFYKERIPSKRRKAGDYILVETPMCAGFKEVYWKRVELIEACRQTENLLNRGVAAGLDRVYPTQEWSHDAAQAIRSEWRQLFLDTTEHFVARDEPVPDSMFKMCAKGWSEQIQLQSGDEGFNPKMNPELDQFQVIKHAGLDSSYFFDSEGTVIDRRLRIAVGVEVFRQSYDVKVKGEQEVEELAIDDGYGPFQFTAHFKGDGKPDFILHDLFSAEEECGLTGMVEFVRLNGWAKRSLKQAVPVSVLADNSVVARKDGKVLGKHYSLPVGNYNMSPKGVIVVCESKPELQSSYQALEAARLVAAPVQDEGFDPDFCMS